MFFYRLFLTLLLSSTTHAADLAGIPPFIDEMVSRHHFNRTELEAVFSQAKHRPDILAAISQPATTKPWLEYRAAFVNARRIKGGLAFWQTHAQTLQQAELQSGVPADIIVALIGVETLYGANTGKFRTLDALTTLAFDYPRRADFFRSELENYLLLARDQEFDLLDIKSSYAGALGIPQFMPSSYRKYAVDFNRNGKTDLLRESEDAIGSVANYLRAYGWKKGQPVACRASLSADAPPPAEPKLRDLAAWKSAGIAPDTCGSADALPTASLLDFTVENGKEYWLAFENFRVITLYNNSNFYAMTVYQLAEALRTARP